MHRHDVLERRLDRGKVLLHEAHRIVVELVREDDRPVRVVRAVLAAVDDRLVVGVDGVDPESRDFVVERVVRPDDGAQAESLSDVSARRGPGRGGVASVQQSAQVSVPSWGPKAKKDAPNTVVDITVGRAPALDRNAHDILDRLLRVVQLGKDLLVRERGHVAMRPGVRAAA
jgi:hypothetical protein